MDSVMVYLVDKDHGIVKLLHPPFDVGPLQPGYIKSYVPGVRENGGQYTHAAIWYIIALARMGLINDDLESAVQKAQDIFHMINPINHARTPIETARYKVEPYVVSADVYSVGKNAGRGGWSWYTGASGWMYRAVLEEILGIKLLEGRFLIIRPYLPRCWDNYGVIYTHRTHDKDNATVHNIQIVRHEESYIEIDGVKSINTEKYQNSFKIPLFTDGKEHSIVVYACIAENNQK